MMIFDHLSHAKIIQSFSLTGVLPITKRATRNKIKNDWLKKWFVKELSVFTKNVHQQFGFTEVNE